MVRLMEDDAGAVLSATVLEDSAADHGSRGGRSGGVSGGEIPDTLPRTEGGDTATKRALEDSDSSDAERFASGASRRPAWRRSGADPAALSSEPGTPKIVGLEDLLADEDPSEGQGQRGADESGQGRGPVTVAASSDSGVDMELASQVSPEVPSEVPLAAPREAPGRGLPARDAASEMGLPAVGESPFRIRVRRDRGPAAAASDPRSGDVRAAGNAEMDLTSGSVFAQAGPVAQTPHHPHPNPGRQGTVPATVGPIRQSDPPQPQSQPRSRDRPSGYDPLAFDPSSTPVSRPSSAASSAAASGGASSTASAAMSVDRAEFQRREVLELVLRSLEALAPGGSIQQARAAAFDIAKLFAVPADVQKIRSQGKLPATVAALSQHAHDPVFVLCAATAMFFVSRDKVNAAAFDTPTVLWLMRVLDITCISRLAGGPGDYSDEADLASLDDPSGEARALHTRAMQLVVHPDPLIGTCGRVRSVHLLLQVLARACEASAIVKDDLRDGGGLGALGRLLHRYAAQCHDGKEGWLAEARNLSVLLRIFEAATFLAPEAQAYLLLQIDLPPHPLHAGPLRSSVVPSIVAILKRAWETIGRARRGEPLAARTGEPLLLELVAGALKALINLSNASGPGTEAIGATGALDAALRCITYTPPTGARGGPKPAAAGMMDGHDLPVLALGLLINSVEFNRANMARVGRVAVRSGGAEVPALQFLLDLYRSRLELAAQLDGREAATSTAAVEARVTASYVALLLGCLIREENNYATVKAMVGGCFESLVNTMMQFISFNKLNGLMSGDSQQSFCGVLETFENAEKRCCPKHGDEALAYGRDAGSEDEGGEDAEFDESG